MRKLVFITFFLLIDFQSTNVFAEVVIETASETMTVSFLNRPPYYFVEENEASGILVDRTRKIFDKAGIEVNFIQRPPKRIMRGIKQLGNEYCSIGWFKNTERETFAKFSDPIFQNEPIVVLINKDKQTAFSAYDSLKSILENKVFRFGSIEDFSYGERIDLMIADNVPNDYKISGEQKQLVRLLSIQRISFMLIAPEEIDTLIYSANLEPGKFLSIQLNDIPNGNKRYIMCNKHVSDEVMKRINDAIREVVVPILL